MLQALTIGGISVLIACCWAFLFWFLHREASTPKIIKPLNRTKK